ncbi:hypothetical protein [Microbacterium sp.]|uniref:hypothetical protein n=1 Tax=Microbacterium sp. TaxID=51671 RepID=UPI002811197F|nr:hypothetical protein [Microbacterium sp.]
MSDPKSYPEDEGPFEPAETTTPAEESEDQGPITSAGGVDDPIEQGEESNVDPDMSPE